MSSRDPQPSDPGGLVFNRIARDGVCIATHPDNRLGNISQEQVQAIFSGRVRSWSEVPGAKASGAIDLIVRNPASGTQDAFQNIFMGQDLRISPSASQRPSNGRVQQAIASNPSAIGYVDFNFTEGLHTVPYKGVACTLRNAKSGQYGGVRNFWLVTRGKATGAGREVDQVRALQQGAQDHRQELGPAQIAWTGRCRRTRRPGGRRHPARGSPSPGRGATGAPSSCSARSRARCWC